MFINFASGDEGGGRGWQKGGEVPIFLTYSSRGPHMFYTFLNGLTLKSLNCFVITNLKQLNCFGNMLILLGCLYHIIKKTGFKA